MMLYGWIAYGCLRAHCITIEKRKPALRSFQACNSEAAGLRAMATSSSFHHCQGHRSRAHSLLSLRDVHRLCGWASEDKVNPGVHEPTSAPGLQQVAEAVCACAETFPRDNQLACCC